MKATIKLFMLPLYYAALFTFTLSAAFMAWFDLDSTMDILAKLGSLRDKK